MDNSTSLQEDRKERKDNYFVWLFKQLHGWPVQNYMLWFFAFGFQLAILIQNKITTLTVITFIGTLLGTLCVLAINATKAINGWLGLISAACFIYAGLAAKNYLSIFSKICLPFSPFSRQRAACIISPGYRQHRSRPKFTKAAAVSSPHSFRTALRPE